MTELYRRLIPYLPFIMLILAAIVAACHIRYYWFPAGEAAKAVMEFLTTFADASPQPPQQFPAY